MSFKVGLALGGGGVRGLAHVGILRVFERERIPVDLIVGTSMGAVIGGAYAISGNAFSVEQKILELLARNEIAKLESLAAQSRTEEKRMIIEGLATFVKELLLWNLKGIKRWIADGAGIRRVIEELMQDAEFSRTRIPFACVACNLKTGEEVILNQGNMTEAVMASSTMPAIFPPVKIGGRLLIDGATTSEVPIEAARKLGADFVIAVNVGSNIYNDNFRHGMDILFQSDEIRNHELMRLKLELADFVITPGVENVSWASFSRGRECIEEGERSAYKAVARLKSALGKSKSAYFLKKLFFMK
ncbi:MAG: patatin-like phospholipase family protein [Candidatus Omnitrophica bacterium]|nr:patatin-like phospholipase family protein [Candidatus Omnitrophota bacterium]